MTNEQTIARILNENGISEFAFLPFEDASKANERLWEKCSGKMKTCIITLFPYRTDYTVKDKYVFSAYARTHDYHKRCEQFFNAVIPRLRNELRHEFEGYADHSPIGEKSAAALCGLGVIGRNTLLINKKYGSYIFIASILTDMVLESHPSKPTYCIDCGRCMQACPGGAISRDGYEFKKCLSYISQKKTKTEAEWDALRKNNVIWGCDICQDVCPLNSGKALSKDGYFADHVLDNVTEELIAGMQDEIFQEYPFSWRKKEVIMQNFKNCSSSVLTKDD